MASRPQDVPQLTFDPDAMHRAILNVVTNAIDACEKDRSGPGHASARSTTASAGRDSRAGRRQWRRNSRRKISPRIFSVFESRKGSRGTGLGLPVSQKIMHEHDGDITVESTPQQGSCFCLQHAGGPRGSKRHPTMTLIDPHAAPRPRPPSDQS